MKKMLYAALYVVCSVVFITGCSNAEKVNEKDKESNTTQIVEESDTEISVVQKVDSDYERMMKDISKLKYDNTIEDVISTLGEPDEEYGSGVLYMKWNYGKCWLETVYVSGWIIHYCDEEGNLYENGEKEQFLEFKKMDISDTETSE